MMEDPEIVEGVEWVTEYEEPEKEAGQVTSPDTPTLRDQFAMAALTGLLSCEETSGDPDEFAEWSYEYADVMLAAREAK